MPRISYEYGYRYKITGLLDHGKVVEKGDSVIQFDVSQVQKYIVSKEDELEMEKAALSKLEVEHRNKEQSLNASLKSEEAEFNLKKLELDKFKFESSVKRKVKAMEYKQAEIKLNKTKRNIELNEKVRENELKIQKLKVMQIENSIQRAESALDKLTVYSSMSGIFQIRENRSTHQPYKLGDEVYMGRAVASVPDLTYMKVNSQVGETDKEKVKIGQDVKVRIDAYPSLAFEGKVTKIGKICHEKEEGDKLKIFEVEISIKESDERLKPGMTVNCEITCENLNNVFYVHNDCLSNSEGEHYIQLREGAEVKKKKVKIGPRNTNYTVIYGNFKTNQKVLPFEKSAGSLNI